VKRLLLALGILVLLAAAFGAAALGYIRPERQLDLNDQAIDIRFPHPSISAALIFPAPPFGSLSDCCNLA